MTPAALSPNYDIAHPHAGDILLMGNFRDKDEDPKAVKALVLKVGRGMTRSILVYQPGGRVKVITEFDYWAEHWNWRIISRRPKNKVWAKNYRKTHTLPDV